MDSNTIRMDSYTNYFLFAGKKELKKEKITEYKIILKNTTNIFL